MKIATWNVNSIKVRLPQVLDWLAVSQVDALCLQELKVDQDKFPIDAFNEQGYQAVWAGQKTYNGVAIISKQPGQDIVRNMPGFDDPQQRIIAATYPLGDATDGTTVRLISAYCPNGQSVGSDKFLYKLNWYRALTSWLKTEMEQYPQLAILGDYNIAPADEDVHNPQKWAGQVLVSEPERTALKAILELGLTDAFRLFEQQPKSFSWWDYRLNGFKRNAGLRIDHVLLSQSLVHKCVACEIDVAPRGNEQPSDHAPVIATI